MRQLLELPRLPQDTVAHDPGLDQPVSQLDITVVDQVMALPPLEKPAATWLLDIDGVVNVIGRPPREGWGRYDHTVVPAFDGLRWAVCYSPTFVSVLNALHEKGIVSFRWLTTWEYDAPRCFAPAVGLNIGAWVAAEDDGDTRRWWKLKAFEQTLSEVDHLVVWTDDDMYYYTESLQVVDFLDPNVAVTICPDSRRGLLPKEFTRILEALQVKR